MSDISRKGPMHGRGPMHMAAAEKPDNFKSSMSKLIVYCKPFAWAVLIAVACDMLGVITRLIGPNKISEITNLISAGLQGEIDLPAIFSICFSYLIFSSLILFPWIYFFTKAVFGCLHTGQVKLSGSSSKGTSASLYS